MLLRGRFRHWLHAVLATNSDRRLNAPRAEVTDSSDLGQGLSTISPRKTQKDPSRWGRSAQTSNVDAKDIGVTQHASRDNRCNCARVKVPGPTSIDGVTAQLARVPEIVCGKQGRSARCRLQRSRVPARESVTRRATMCWDACPPGRWRVLEVSTSYWNHGVDDEPESHKMR